MHKLHWEIITGPLLVQRAKERLLRKWCVNDTLRRKRRYPGGGEHSRPQMCETSMKPGVGKCEQLHAVKWPMWRAMGEEYRLIFQATLRTSDMVLGQWETSDEG